MRPGLAFASATSSGSVRADSDVTLIKIGRRYAQSVLRQDDKLRRALIAVGEAQRKKKFEAIGFRRGP